MRERMLNKVVGGKNIHFIGIKGVGMSALAILAKEKGYQVTGSDLQESFVTDELLGQAKIPINNFDAANLSRRPDFVVISAAFGKDNVEVKEARRKHLEILNYSEALSFLIGNTKTIAVSGIHGKTTTAALISFILQKAGLDPSFAIGAGNIPTLRTNAHAGKGEYFVVEADEYRKSEENKQSKFLDLNPLIEVITSIEMDHPDLFSSIEDVYHAFYKFACRVSRKGFIVICTDYPKARKLIRSIADRKFETYGFELGADWRITDFIEDENKTIFSLASSKKTGIKYGPFKLKIPGRANVLNATAAIITTLKLELSEDVVSKALSSFSGAKRRFEKIVEKNGIVLLDDYAHHPRSVFLTLQAVKKKYPSSKIICIFQPHTYSRTKILLADFAKAFTFADKVYIADIYASQREKEATITGQELANAISKYHRSVKYFSDWDRIVDDIAQKLKKPTVLISMGAGDIYKIQTKLQNKLFEASS